jgi:hypothetical protein
VSEHGRHDGANAEVDHIARLMMAEWERVEGKPVNVSYVATFADMARVILASNASLTKERDELHSQLKAVVDYAVDVLGWPVSTVLGPDAPLRAFRKLHEQLIHASAENQAFNIKVAGEINEARAKADSLRSQLATVTAERDRMARVYEAAKRIERGCVCEYDYRCGRCEAVKDLHAALAAEAGKETKS